MSDSREQEKEKSLTNEDEKLTSFCSNFDGDDRIDREHHQQQVLSPSDQRKARNKREKAKKFLLSRVSNFDKHLVGAKNKTAAPFPYNGEDFGGIPSRYLCLLRPSINTGTSAAVKTPGATRETSYYDFLKSLIEKNDFYSPECNVHGDITSSRAE